MSTVVTTLLWTLIGVATSYLAYQRGRDPYIWFALGIFFGVLAMLVLVFLPSLKTEQNPLELEEQKTHLKQEEILESREKQVEEEEKLENAPDQQPQSVEAKEWFYLDKAHQQQGPFSFYVMNQSWENGDIDSQSYVWSEGMPEWKRIRETAPLHNLLEQLDLENRKSFPEDL